MIEQSAARSAKTIHLAVVASIVFWIVLWSVARVMVRPFFLGPEARAWVKPAFLTLMAVMTFLNVHARQRMRDPERASVTWWADNRAFVLLAWASAELTVIFTLVLWYLHGFGGMPIMAGAWALFLLLVISRPAYRAAD